ncbi:MAG: isoaspartyl peptidase/L-asparaginase, partial [Saprospiraceae bacterium]|nr:isoaspartyl peptidase/L-asparaginase [Saprospiraceae bacterium]
MKNPLFSLIAVLSLFQSCTPASPESAAGDSSAPYAIVIHGGAGAITRAEMTPEMEQEYLKVLNEALDIGEMVLRDGGTSLDAVEKTIMYLEDSPLFNAGKGAVFTHEGKNELDASVMEGASLKAGAVGGLTIVKNPIRAARAVMEKSQHVLLVGKGAEQFAIEQKIDTVSPEYFFTQPRWDALERAKAEENKQEGTKTTNPDYKFGTVGCVALDQSGNLAAGTSTGGMTNKRWNRLGDAPVIGAGTYANNATCGVSCTGHGEFFIRYAVAHDVSAMMEYKGSSVQEAADYIVNQKLKNAGGEGGLIALDRKGNIAMPFNSEGMYRGYSKAGER